MIKFDFKKWLSETSTSTADVASYAMPIGFNPDDPDSKSGDVRKKTDQFDKNQYKVCGLGGCIHMPDGQIKKAKKNKKNDL